MPRSFPTFQHVVIDADNPPDPHCKAAGDLDGDGFPDLFGANWNNGSPTHGALELWLNQR